MPEEKKVAKGYGIPVDPPPAITGEEFKTLEIDKSKLKGTEEEQDAKRTGDSNT